MTSLLLSFQPTAAMAALWDEFSVEGIRINHYFIPTASPTVAISYGHPHAICFDPSNNSLGGGTAPTNLQQVMAYRNSEVFQLSAFRPEISYEIKKPTHPQIVLSGGNNAGLSSIPLSTADSWVAGTYYISAWLTGVTEGVGYNIEWIVRYSRPRNET
jgi:hypothetical protein